MQIKPVQLNHKRNTEFATGKSKVNIFLLLDTHVSMAVCPSPRLAELRHQLDLSNMVTFTIFETELPKLHSILEESFMHRY